MKIVHLFSGAFPTLSGVQKVTASFCLMPVKGLDTEVVQVTTTKFIIVSTLEVIGIGKLPWLPREQFTLAPVRKVHCSLATF